MVVEAEEAEVVEEKLVTDPIDKDNQQMEIEEDGHSMEIGSGRAID